MGDQARQTFDPGYFKLETLYDMTVPGDYTVQASRHVDGGTEIIKSNIIKIRTTP